MKRIFSWILVFCLIVSVLPAAVFAAEGGSCGENVSWSIQGNTLEISGSGAMYEAVDGYWGWEEYAESITAIRVSEGVTGIGAYAFAGFPSLKSVTLPSSLDYIGEGAFYLCESLSSVTLPDGLLGIGEGAFMGTGLTSVKIPRGLTSLGMLAFSGCAKLKKFTVSSSNSYFNADPSGALYNKDRSVLHVVPGAVSGDYSVQSGVKAINHYAFYGCSAIKSVYIPSSVVELGSMLFVGCTSMTRIKVSSNSERFAHDSNGFLYNKDKNILLAAPAGISGTISIPETTKKIYYYAFAYCDKITGVKIPDSITNISEGAFAYCTGLKEVTIPSDTNFGYYVFSGCTALEKVVFDGSGCDSIAEGTFMDCISLKEISGIERTSYIWDYAFAGCISLEHLTLGGTDIGDYAFAACLNLKEVTITDRSSNLDPYAFAYCPDLTLHFVNSAWEWEDNVFYMSNVTVRYPGQPKYEWKEKINFDSIAGNVTWEEYYYDCEEHDWSTWGSSSSDVVNGLSYARCNICEALRKRYWEAETGNVEIAWDFWENVETVDVRILDKLAGKTAQRAIPATLPVPEDPKDAPPISVQLPENATLILEIPTEVISEEVAVYMVGADGSYTALSGTKLTEQGIQVTVSSNCNLVVAKEKKAELKNPFTDVGENNRFKPAILWAYYNGITAGKTPTTFEPDSEVTRAQFVTFLWRAAGEPEPASKENPFTDIPDGKYYTKAVLWAYHEGIAVGKTTTTFCPEDTCTRGQVALFLYRYAGEPEVDSLQNPFTDVNAENRYYKAIMWAYSNGITSGATETSFGINSTCIRAHVVTFLYRYLA